MQTRNDVYLNGTIVHKFVTPKIAILTIGTGNATPTQNFPKVLFFGYIIKEIDEKYNIGDHVDIVWNIQSSRRRPDIKNQNMVSIFGETIKFSESVMKETFGIDVGEKTFRYKNEINICGKVTGIEKKYSNLVKIRVETHKNDRLSYVNLVHYTNNPEKLLSEIKTGDNVYIIGCVQTTKKGTGDDIHHFENYVATEIMKK